MEANIIQSARSEIKNIVKVLRNFTDYSETGKAADLLDQAIIELTPNYKLYEDAKEDARNELKKNAPAFDYAVLYAIEMAKKPKYASVTGYGCPVINAMRELMEEKFWKIKGNV